MVDRLGLSFPVEVIPMALAPARALEKLGGNQNYEWVSKKLTQLSPTRAMVIHNQIPPVT